MNAPRAARTDVSGVLLLDKPRGLTSQQAVARIKRLFAARKAGHTGTLDPMADGLLPVGLGEATKFSQFLLDADKGYLATLQLGVTTNTGDAEGEILVQREVAVTTADIDAVLNRFVGLHNQTPPMHSAVKVAGKPLYAYARAGVTIERKSRVISIYSLQLIDFKDNILNIRVRCSKGTYIRVLAEDIGNALGCGAHLTALTRDVAGGYLLADTVAFEALEAMTLEERMARLLPPESFASSLPRMDLAGNQQRQIISGQAVALPGPGAGLYRLYGIGEAFLGVGEVLEGTLRARRLISQPPAAVRPENSLSNPSVTG